jgi:hypothetical protein
LDMDTAFCSKVLRGGEGVRDKVLGARRGS